MKPGLLLHIQRHTSKDGNTWQFFGSMTYKNKGTMSEAVRRKMQFQFLRRVAALGKLHFNSLEWVIREEFGEATGRLHWHFLIAGMPAHNVTSNTNLFLMGYWEGMGGGMARIRLYDEGQNAASYICKGLEDSSGANAYEVGKFGYTAPDGSVMLIPAQSLLRQWKRDLEPNRRHRSAREMRDSSHT